MNSNKNKGLTLIEILVTVTVFAILIAIAAPSLNDFTERNRLSSQTNILVAHLNLARSEAVKRNQSISTCISNSAFSACLSPGATTSQPWENGWIVFVDMDGDGNYETGDGDSLLQVGEALGGGSTIRSGQYFSEITYNNDGSVTAPGTFKVCNQDATLTMARAINISTAGHISMGNDADDDGIPNDYTNTELTSCT
jgi:type IV fimbrial biogenesis protein FimT